MGFVIALLVGIILFPLAFSGQLFSLAITETSLPNAFGNGHWQSAVYAFWDSAFAVSMMLILIPLFRRFGNARTRLGAFLSLQSYTVYIIHVVIIVYAAYLLREVSLVPLLKFAVASLIVVPLCFVFAYGIRKLPLVAEVL